MSSSRSDVQEYYGKTLKSSDDLKTNACCSAEAFAPHLRPIVSEIHEEVVTRFYGCGSPIPMVLAGRTVLDLGSGTGRDCYILSKLVGEQGRVIGVDMTDEQLEVAQRHRDYHADKFGFEKSNVRFLKGYIEDLAALDIADDSIDVVVSNCVINLSPDKRRVFSEILRVLKPGGELYFADILSGRRIPESLQRDPVLVGECLGGALYIEDFRRLLAELGCLDYRVVSMSPLDIEDEAIAKKLGPIPFYSMTIRAFKLPLEDRCEDYGQTATYQGNLAESPAAFALDQHHLFEAGKVIPVCSNTAAMLSATRYAPYFRIVGDCSTHFGLFDCHHDEALEPGIEKRNAGSCC